MPTPSSARPTKCRCASLIERVFERVLTGLYFPVECFRNHSQMIFSVTVVSSVL